MKRVACLFLLILSFAVVEPFFFVIETLWTIYEIGNEFLGYTSTDPSNADLLDSLIGLKDDINQVTKDVTRRIDHLYQDLIVQLPRLGQINRGLESFSRLFNRISYLYKVFERVVNPPTKILNDRALKDFSTVGLGIFSDSVDATLDAIHELFIPTEIGHLNDGLLTLLVQNLPDASSNPVRCNAGPPPEEQFYLLYMALLTAEVRGFMMLAFTYKLIQNVTGGDYADDIQAGRITTMTRVQEYMWHIRDIVNWTSPVYFACDPSDGYERGVSFAELEMFQSTYVVNQNSINSYCGGSCEQIDQTFSQGLKCANEDKLCQTVEKCTGRINKCLALARDNIQICINTNETIGSKRYMYIAAGRYVKLGSESDCEANNRFQPSPFAAYSSEYQRDYVCDYCKCFCTEEVSTKFFAFNLRPQLADIGENKIVSGIKFTITPNVVHVQIQQGAAQNDRIANDTLEWKAVDVMQVKGGGQTGNTASLFDESGKKYVEGVDFARLTWDHKDIYIDDLVVPDGYVVTGARLNRPSFDEKAIQLELQATLYNFTSGKLITSDNQPSIWITPWDMKNVLPEYSSPIRELILERDIAIKRVRLNESTKVISKPYTWIGIMLSNQLLDIGGTVFPLLDIREVTPLHPFLLQGISLMYKQPEESKGTGFLAFSLRSVSRRKFLEGEITMD